MMRSPEAVRGLCGGGSGRKCSCPLTYPQMPPVHRLVAGSRSTAVLADRAGTEEEEEQEREEEEEVG